MKELITSEKEDGQVFAGDSFIQLSNLATAFAEAFC